MEEGIFNGETVALPVWKSAKGAKLRQYTGLKDRNGKEIYEGDILDCTCELLTNFGRTRTGKMGTTIYEVFWRDGGWRERVIRSDSLVSGKDSDGVAVTAKYSKVIGNIHEHPHLLNQE
ncbi:hypothetical protein C4A76_14850 [Brevibacillus laterosporus]|nr:hypothetical protein C4A76_14850 [Brevibacillus laterosporus]